MVVWVVVDSKAEDSACHSPEEAVASRMDQDAEDEGPDEEDVEEEARRSFVNSLDDEDEDEVEVVLAVEEEGEENEEVRSRRAEEERSCPAGEGASEGRRRETQTGPGDRGGSAAWGAG